MTAAGMLCHLNDSLLLPLGEKAAEPLPGIFPRTAMKWGALYLPIRWPRGAPSAPEWIQGVGGTSPGDFEADRARLLDSLARFADPELPLEEPRHPLFARMSRMEWMRWGYLHIDHHLRQFGA